jgi:hypothetical protein
VRTAIASLTKPALTSGPGTFGSFGIGSRRDRRLTERGGMMAKIITRTWTSQGPIGKRVRQLAFESSTRRWAELHEESFRRLGGAVGIRGRTPRPLQPPGI